MVRTSDHYTDLLLIIILDSGMTQEYGRYATVSLLPVASYYPLTYSFSATVMVDIAEHLPSDTLAGGVYLGALPYIGPIMGKVGTSTILGFLPGLTSETDVVLSSSTATAFADSLFTKPDEVPWEIKCLWIGMAAYQTPKHRSFALSRPQSPEKFLGLGQKGFPLLIVNGTQDRQVFGHVVVEEMKPYFKNLDVCMIENGGGHAVHYENEKEVMDSITAFARKVGAKVSRQLTAHNYHH